MNLLSWVFLDGSTEDRIALIKSEWPWLTERGAKVAAAKINEACKNEESYVEKIHMSPVRSWKTGIIRVFVSIRFSDKGIAHVQINLDSEADPNFDVREICALGIIKVSVGI
jgi:hypothetical protein